MIAMRMMARVSAISGVTAVYLALIRGDCLGGKEPLKYILSLGFTTFEGCLKNFLIIRQIWENSLKEIILLLNQ
jgi:hypothetical protein